MTENNKRMIENLSRSLLGMQTQAKMMLSMVKPLLEKHNIKLRQVIIKRKSKPNQIILGWLIEFPNEAIANNFIAQAGGSET